MRSPALFLAVAVALTSPQAHAATAGLEDAIFLVGWSNYLDQHCSPWHMDHRKAGHLLGNLAVDETTQDRITRGAIAFALKMQQEGDPNAHCQEAFEQLGPRGLNVLFTR